MSVSRWLFTSCQLNGPNCRPLRRSQEYIKAKGLKVVVIFEGRDAAGEPRAARSQLTCDQPSADSPVPNWRHAGKGGVISRVAEAMSPRICKVVALGTPTERDKSQARRPGGGSVRLCAHHRRRAFLPRNGESLHRHRTGP